MQPRAVTQVAWIAALAGTSSLFAAEAPTRFPDTFVWASVNSVLPVWDTLHNPGKVANGDPHGTSPSLV